MKRTETNLRKEQHFEHFFILSNDKVVKTFKTPLSGCSKLLM